MYFLRVFCEERKRKEGLFVALNIGANVSVTSPSADFCHGGLDKQVDDGDGRERQEKVEIRVDSKRYTSQEEEKATMKEWRASVQVSREDLGCGHLSVSPMTFSSSASYVYS